MGRLWAMDQAISKCKEVGGVKCAALGRSKLLLAVSDHACHRFFDMKRQLRSESLRIILQGRL